MKILLRNCGNFLTHRPQRLDFKQQRSKHEESGRRSKHEESGNWVKWRYERDAETIPLFIRDANDIGMCCPR